MAVARPSRTRSPLVLVSRNSNSDAKSSGTICQIRIEGVRNEGVGTSIPLPLNTVTCTVCGVIPSDAVTDDGTVVQVVPVGAAQVNATLWLKPPSGVIVALKMSGLLPVSDAGAVTWKSQPVPVSGIVCGLEGTLSVIVSVPVRAPTAVGAKVTLIVQVAFDASVAGGVGQLFVGVKSPEAAIELMVTGPRPELVTVTAIGALVVVSICPPKGRVVGLNEIPGAVVDPVPDKFTVNTSVLDCPPLVTTAVITKLADSAAATEGVNVTLTVQGGAPAATLGLQAFDDIAKSVLAAGDTPVTTILLNVTMEAVLFVTRKAWGILATPSCWIPKLNGEGVTVRLEISDSLAT